MIKYALKCSEGHRFESWFQSAEAYDALAASGHLTCAICGASDVSKELMSPRVAARDVAPPSQTDAPQDNVPSVSESAVPLRGPQDAALAALRKHVEDNATYVGRDFATQARDMHLGETPHQAIYGEAAPEEAKALIEDGVPVAPLPFRPTNKSN